MFRQMEGVQMSNLQKVGTKMLVGEILQYNSIYSDLNGNLYDPFNGKEDLEKKIQFIGDPEKRIKEDYLRILRYIRFFLNYSNLNII